MKLFVGTSGFSYKEWKGSFYPEDLPDKKMLEYYGQQLTGVEINNTFYRMPRASVLQSWAEQVPEEFRFVLKASRRITHFKRLKDAGDETEYLLKTSETLGARLGATLFQLPGNVRKDAERLENFLKLLPLGTRAAFEFRHESWLDNETFDLLRKYECALCTVDTDEDLNSPLLATAPWGYLRLRRPKYSDEELKAWSKRVFEQPWREAFVFFKHEEAGSGTAAAKGFLGS